MYSKTGYRKDSKDRKRPFNIIPSNRISMKNVDIPLFAISDIGESTIMYPNEEYLFGGNRVLEIPMKQSGGIIDPSIEALSRAVVFKNRNLPWIDRALHPEKYPIKNQKDFMHNGQKMSHMIGWGEGENGEYQVFPTIGWKNDSLQWNDRQEPIRVRDRKLAEFLSENGIINHRIKQLGGNSGDIKEQNLMRMQKGGIGLVDYLSSKGLKYDKQSRMNLAKQKGIKNYDFSAAKNIELLNLLRGEESAPIARPKIINVMPPKPIKSNTSANKVPVSARTSNTKRVTIDNRNFLEKLFNISDEEDMKSFDLPNDVYDYYQKYSPVNKGKKFGIVSKNNARAYFFDKDGNLAIQDEVGLGKDRGEQQPVFYKVQTTPSGEYKIERSKKYSAQSSADRSTTGYDASNFFYIDNVDPNKRLKDDPSRAGTRTSPRQAIHGLPTHLIDKRLPALRNNKVEDNYMSAGCINCKKEFLDNPYFSDLNNGMLYVTPDAKFTQNKIALKEIGGEFQQGSMNSFTTNASGPSISKEKINPSYLGEFKPVFVTNSLTREKSLIDPNKLYSSQSNQSLAIPPSYLNAVVGAFGKRKAQLRQEQQIQEQLANPFNSIPYVTTANKHLNEGITVAQMGGEMEDEDEEFLFAEDEQQAQQQGPTEEEIELLEEQERQARKQKLLEGFEETDGEEAFSIFEDDEEDEGVEGVSDISNNPSKQTSPVSTAPVITNDDANINKIAESIGQYESGNNYSALGPVVTKGRYKGQRALGKYQIMPGNIPEWSKEALGRVVTTEEFLSNPEIQDKIAYHQMKKIQRKYGSAQDVASVWFTGRPSSQKVSSRDDLGTSQSQYINNVMGFYNK
jgi:hypothetical protein